MFNRKFKLAVTSLTYMYACKESPIQGMAKITVVNYWHRVHNDKDTRYQQFGYSVLLIKA